MLVCCYVHHSLHEQHACIFVLYELCTPMYCGLQEHVCISMCFVGAHASLANTQVKYSNWYLLLTPWKA